ncbi:MAG TPA: hypothetical protein DEP60_05200, partial [Ruminococcaceae bacterium]|nr:hypothetical protein [Oscillospiraceae bacterium]
KSVGGLIQIALLRNQAGLCGLTEVKQQQGQLLLYPKELDMKWIACLSATYPQRVLVNAGNRPYLSLHLQPDEDVLSLLKEILHTSPKMHSGRKNAAKEMDKSVSV